MDEHQDEARGVVAVDAARGAVHPVGRPAAPGGDPGRAAHAAGAGGGWRLRDVAALLAVWAVLPGLLGGMVAATLGGGARAGVGEVAFITSGAGGVVGVLLLARRLGLGMADLGWRRPPGRWLPGTFGVALLLLAGNLAIGLTLQALGADRLVGTPADAAGLAASSPSELLLVLLAAAVVVPVSEELAFRGVLQRGLAARWGIRVALPVAALAFLLVHGSDMGAFHLVAGLGYGWLAHRAGSIWPAVLAHGCNNAALVLLVSL